MKITTYTGRRLIFSPRFVGARASEAATVPNLKKEKSEGSSVRKRGEEERGERKVREKREKMRRNEVSGFKYEIYSLSNFS